LSRSRQQTATLFRKIPPVNAVLERPEVVALARRYSRSFITNLVREALEDLRRDVETGKADLSSVERFSEDLSGRLEETISERFGSHLIGVLNATGVIVHTNLGRSPLPPKAVERITRAASSYCDLEYRLDEGERGSRQELMESLLMRLFPGTRGLAVNNNAGAVLLALNTLAEGREVPISRGELVEIGGSFRIPDVMAKSGAILREVGTTNRTRSGDFEEALSERTGLILKVHSSNYRIVGFVEETPLERLAALARERGLPLMVDQGSGNLLDLSPFGIDDEPTVADLLREGADVVTFSGDKLLGGPQAGIVVGREDLVAAMKTNPLYRALRPDKTTVAALEATLESFVAGDPLREIPTLRMLSLTADRIGARAEAMASSLRKCPGEILEARVVPGSSRVGGGAAPVNELPTRLLALKPRSMSAERYESALRRGRPPVVARVREGWLQLDLRTVPEEEEGRLQQALVDSLSAD
jgi:L-seryl-tRNA(Ser) seleniumtransferase